MSEIEPMKIEDARHIADPSSRHPGAWNRPTIAAAKLAVELADKCERLENITNIRGRHEAIMNSQSTRLGEWVRETGCTSPADAKARIQDLARMATEARARAHELEGLLRLRERVTVDQPGATRVPPAPVASDQPAPCPSCGREDVIERAAPSGKWGWFCCENRACLLSGPLGTDRADAINKWNRLSLAMGYSDAHSREDLSKGLVRLRIACEAEVSQLQDAAEYILASISALEGGAK